MAIGEAGTAARRAAEHPWVERLFRAGLVAKGVLYATMALLALGVALELGGRTTDQAGALRTLAGSPGGAVLTGLLAAGLVGYAAWRLAQAALDTDREGTDAGGLASRAGAAASGVVHLGLAVLAVRLMADAGGGSSGGGERQATAGVLGWTGGRAIVAAAALLVIGVGAYNAWEGLSRRFMRRMRVAGGRRRLVERLGAVGYIARGAVFALVGAFLMKAAVEYDPSEAVGIDGALARLARQPYGTALLVAVALGLLAYAATCIAQARYREV
ncbi:DUF1206 domain-containing protein [Miltoncostaea marina]|uniref:DUF1206 domain-containing protein n=1 Tax=Miltoncostaea marina TaxID=2843215 RepID=UPI001C3C624B|nr:DUF1206 domain-containing protein [Miltoncostaea marina]